jgi:hypothetical protein
MPVIKYFFYLNINYFNNFNYVIVALSQSVAHKAQQKVNDDDDDDDDDKITNAHRKVYEHVSDISLKAIILNIKYISIF